MFAQNRSLSGPKQCSYESLEARLVYSRNGLVFRDSPDVEWFESSGLSLLNNYRDAGVAPELQLVRKIDDALVFANVGDGFTHVRALDAIFAELGG